MWLLLLASLTLCPEQVVVDVRAALPCTSHSTIGSVSATAGPQMRANLNEVANLLERAVALIHQATSVNSKQPPHLSTPLNSAISVLESVVALVDGSICPSLAAIARNNLGLARYLAGQPAPAILDDFRAALKHDPFDDIAMRNRAWALQAVPHEKNHDGLTHK